MKSASDEKVERLRKQFYDLDINHSGYITRETVAQILRSQGEEIERLMVLLLFEKYDKNRDHLIDIDEYIQFCLEVGGLPERQILRRIFDYCDLDQNQKLDVSEVKRLGSLMGLDVTVPDALATVEALDSNLDRAVDFDEFCSIIGH